MWGESEINPEGELKVSFGYQCNGFRPSPLRVPDGYEPRPGINIPRTSSFSCLSGAALSANATLANTNICNGLLGDEILPSWDSPRSFRKVPSSQMDILCSSLQSSMSNLSCSPSSATDPLDYDCFLLKSVSDPSKSESFLNVMEAQVAGGAAGEDRVQAVCSEEHGWLFVAIYDGFNGRDAADFLAGTLYETIIFHFNLWNWESKKDNRGVYDLDLDGPLQYNLEDGNLTEELVTGNVRNRKIYPVGESPDSFRQGVIDSLQRALSQAESDFLYMVEQEMEDRPDLVSVGSCVLIVLIHGDDLYTLNLGDSRAVLATYGEKGKGISGNNEKLKAVQLTESHTVDNDIERAKLVSEHPDDPMTVVGEKVKGKLKVTRAFGVGYLKKQILNDALMGILQVRNLISPPYVSTQPSLNVHRISKADRFVIVASDGLFDFISNEEAVKLVHSYITNHPSGDPAMFLVEQLVMRAADYAGFSWEELMNIPPGRRRKYHDDVTVIVVILGANHRTSKASTFAG